MIILTLIIFAIGLMAIFWYARHERQLRAVTPGAPLTSEQAELGERLRQHVEQLAGEIGERNLWRLVELRAAADYIENQLQASGLTVERLGYQVEGQRVENLVAEIAGSSHPERILVVGAHYDSVRGSPGANDNASGVAALLELARRLAGSHPKQTLRFVAFVNEEPPFFKSDDMGSRVYAELARNRQEQIIGMLCLETLGFYLQEPLSQNYPFPPMVLYYPDAGNFLAFVTNFSSHRLLRKSLKLFRQQRVFPAEGLVAPGWLPGVDWSDHWSFWRVGYPAIMLTDTALYRYPHYHSHLDLPEQLSYPEFARVVDGLVRVIGELSNSAR